MKWRLPALSLLASPLLLAGGLLAAGSAAAHNFHMGLADISYNARSGNTEIVHTYTAHDLATLLTDLYGRNLDLGQPDSEAAIRKYVERQFYLEDAGGRRLPLQWLGVKADADSVTIYQEIAGRKLAPATRIHNTVLIDFQPAQKNTVNVQTDGPVQTLIFDQQHVQLEIR
ncbi:DUF6702 family protein [Pseudoduganella danionis]|uniref:DUF6702 family protein n=1 Tax=Pseudoduganella danionis TaxID=1890295 RepID=UPI0035B2F8BB